MKRLRSYGEDLDDVVGKEWERREIDADRSSSRRRFYVKSESLRRSSSSLYDRSMDEDREAMRPPRKRFEHDVDGFDRRKIFDRYQDGGGGGGGGGVDRVMHVSSPRVPYGSERMHRSESFSTIRRDFPKGFRSERDRSRREGCGGLSWRRLSGGKEAADEEKWSPARDSEDRSKTRSRDSSSGEQSKDSEVVKANLETVLRESCSSSEMEEGELEPDPLPEPSIDTGAQAERYSQHCKDKEDVIKNVSEVCSENKGGVQLSMKPSDSANGTSCGERSMEMEVTQITRKVTLQEERIEIVENINEEIRAKVEESLELRRQRESSNLGQEEAKDLPVDIYKEEKPEDTPCREKKDLVEDTSDEVKHEDTSCREKKEILSGVSSPLPSQFSILESKIQLVEPVIKDDELVNVHTSSLDGNLEEMVKEVHFRDVEVDEEMKEVTCVDIEVLQRKDKGIDQVGFGAEQRKIKSFDLQAETVGEVGYCNSVKVIKSENNSPSKVMLENPRDKGKSIARSLSNMADSADDEDAVEGPSRSRGFELVFHDNIIQPDKASSCGLIGGLIKNEKLKLEPLDLSLSLPGVLPDQNSKPRNSNPSSPVRTRSIQSFPSSFRTISDGFTNSISFSSSQPFVHNPSCSLTQNSVENFEQSVGSRPVFPGVDQVSSGTIRQSQASIEPKRKGGAGALFHRVLMNGNHSQNSIPGVNGHHNLNSNPLLRQPSFPRQPSPQSVGSRDTLSEHSKDKRMLTRERSFNSLSKSEQREGEQVVVNVLSVVERIITRIVSEPLQVMERMLHDMSEHSMEYLKDSICKMLSNADKRGQIHALQGTLQKRSDLTAETMLRCPKTLLEVLVALKTGLPDFLQRSNNVPSSDLVEIYHNLKCRNIACRSMLPVDDCDCKICSKKNGFCSACMCLICSKFDMASNTCSWVGCDVCLHWCHTDCGLRGSHIKNGRSSSLAPEATEMQFHCVACGHPSEMYGFVKEVFKMCSKDWKVEILAKELQYVRRIFCTSNDTRGKSLYQVAGQMLVKLEDKKRHSEVIKNIMSFLSESESSFNSAPPLYPPIEPPVNNDQRGNATAFPIEDTPWSSPISSTKISCLPHNTASDDNQLCRQRKDSSILQTKFVKKPMVDELESVVGFKQAEAKLYQERADNARREADGLKCIAAAKNGKIEDEYRTKIAKLQLYEAEENRRQKIEELQALERAHHDFVSLKTRMEAEIKDLLLKMEATSRNFNA